MSARQGDLSYLPRMNCFSCQRDQRFSYFIYVPKNWNYPERERPERYNLAVLVHGSERSAEMYRNAARPFAEMTDTVILAPLFPAGITDFYEMDNFCHLRHLGVSYDLILLHMIEEISERFPVDSGNILLHGFSAGSQFAHRFFYLHPQSVRSLSIGACARVTLMDENLPWPSGIKDMHDIFGVKPDYESYKKTMVQFVIGSEDNFKLQRETTVTRLEQLSRLRDSYNIMGLETVVSVVAGVGHKGLLLINDVFEFFVKNLERR
ncbi:MAG: alpha/beta hydrolase [Deltaproteobacteria bacterium]|jgi:pimeloyl-ACP methyl ester carboxylesterase|nr:alpha/beta hydrolase [Deltaproteobacteria bacterium]